MKKETDNIMTYDFRKNIINGTLHHAFIIEGPYSADKKNYAVELAQAILCKQMPGVGCGECVICRKLKDGNHLDFVFVEPYAKKGSKTRSVKDEQIEQLQERLMRKPFEGDRVIAVIDGTDTVTARAFNRFLKTLEEPPEGTVIFLLSENAAKLPQTIRSRCVHVRLYGNEGKDNMKASKEAWELISFMADGDYFYREKQLIESFVKDRESAYTLLDAMESIYRDILFGKEERDIRITKEQIYRAVDCIEEARRELVRNAVPGYALKKMVLNIGG